MGTVVTGRRDGKTHPSSCSHSSLSTASARSRNRIHAIVNGSHAIIGDTDLRSCKCFGRSDGYFLQLQNASDTLEAICRLALDIKASNILCHDA